MVPEEKICLLPRIYTRDGLIASGIAATDSFFFDNTTKKWLRREKDEMPINTYELCNQRVENPRILEHYDHGEEYHVQVDVYCGHLTIHYNGVRIDDQPHTFIYVKDHEPVAWSGQGDENRMVSIMEIRNQYHLVKPFIDPQSKKFMAEKQDISLFRYYANRWSKQSELSEMWSDGKYAKLSEYWFCDRHTRIVFIKDMYRIGESADDKIRARRDQWVQDRISELSQCINNLKELANQPLLTELFYNKETRQKLESKMESLSRLLD